MVKYESRQYWMNLSGYQQVTKDDGKKEWVRFKATAQAKIDLMIESVGEGPQDLINGVPYIQNFAEPALIGEDCAKK